MSVEAEPVAARLAPRFEATPGIWAALVTTLMGALCLALGPHLLWLVGRPAALTLPMTDWVGASLTWLLEGIKPLARGVSTALQYVFDPAVGIGFGLDILCLFAQSRWPAAAFHEAAGGRQSRADTNLRSGGRGGATNRRDRREIWATRRRVLRRHAQRRSANGGGHG